MAKYTAKEMIAALRATKGNKAAACRQVGCARNTMDRYIREYSTVEEAYNEINEATLDMGESMLTQFMEGTVENQSTREQLDAIKFYLATKAKHRGYSKRIEQQHQGEDGGPVRTVNANMDLSEFEDEDDPEKLMRLFEETFAS